MKRRMAENAKIEEGKKTREGEKTTISEKEPEMNGLISFTMYYQCAYLKL